MLELLRTPGTMNALFEHERRHVRALRASAIARRRDGCPLQAAAGHIGSLRAAVLRADEP